jgi:GNAT superfamily N-acetyltransferase
MADADRDKMLRAMAENRGCKLAKSRRRTPGVGDYGRYGLTDAKTGKEVLGFGADGLTASPEEVEAWLRGSLAATWKRSLMSAVAAPAEAPVPKRTKRKDPGEEAASAPPPPRPKPKLVRAPEPEPELEEEPEPNLAIRPAKAADGEVLAALLDLPPAGVVDRLRLFLRANEPPLLAERDGELVGCVAWHAAPALHRAPEGQVSFVFVAEGLRHQGIGRALIDAAAQRLAAAGCAALTATGDLKPGAANDFYRHTGFERAGYLFARPTPEAEG